MAQHMDGNVSHYFHPQTNWRFSDDFPIPTAVLIEFERVSNPSILLWAVWAPDQAAGSRLKVLQIVAWKLEKLR